LFEKKIPGVKVEPVLKDLTLSGLKTFSERLEEKDFNDYNSVMIFVISHGAKGDVIISSDDEKFQVKELVTQMFYKDNKI
jgi:hypothetical protein